MFDTAIAEQQIAVQVKEGRVHQDRVELYYRRPIPARFS